MNRQLVAFLSLFSLVLVLSVYYVMMPSTTTQLKENAQSVNLNVKDATTLYFESLDLERDNAHQEYIDERNASRRATGTRDGIKMGLSNRTRIALDSRLCELYNLRVK